MEGVFFHHNFMKEWLHENDMDKQKYLGMREKRHFVLPWSFIDTGIDFGISRKGIKKRKITLTKHQLL
jgi:hypothetical protein